ncbi:hypothetical protein EL22_28325 [Halostagnicola sp. A56]|nr:hypothetical protein EL22_28325 [Halostagnicola sp. A56]
MGWNSWNTFYCDINAGLIKETADAMVESGMKEVGYEYICIDDCWMAPERDATGNLQADPETFPNGISAVADYIHERGLKLGIYQSAGTSGERIDGDGLTFVRRSQVQSTSSVETHLDPGGFHLRIL